MQLFTPLVRARPPADLHLSPRRGFTLTELAIVLGIVGAIIGVIWVAASNVYLKQKTDDAMVELSTITQNILAVWQGQDFANASYASSASLTSAFITGKLIPDWAVIPGSPATISNPWSASGVTIAVGSAKLSGISATKWFGITFTNVPVQACVIMATQSTSCTYGSPGCPLRVIATGNANAAVNLLPTTTTPVMWQMYSEDATAACAGASGSSTVDTVEFDYSL